MDSDPQKNSMLETAKSWITLAMAIVTSIAGIVLWVQNSSDEKFDNIQNQITTIRSDIDKIEESNQVILRIIGRLEGKIDN
jgi:hypothetical protein